MQYPNPVGDSEELARFVMSSRYCSGGSVKFNVFLPANDNELSVYRVSGIDHPQTLAIGQQYVSGPQNKTLYGYASILASAFVENGLGLKTTPDPHPRHTNVVGWKDSVTNRSIAQRLVAHAVWNSA